MYILLVLLLWGSLIQPPSQKRKQKTVIKPMVQSLQMMENQKQRTMGNSVSSLEPLFKLRRLNYLEDYQLPWVGWSIFSASECPSTLGLGELDGFSCRGTTPGNAGKMCKACSHKPLQLSSRFPHFLLSPTLRILYCSQEKENTTTYSHPPGVNREWWCGKFRFSSSHIRLGFLNFPQRIICLFNQKR